MTIQDLIINISSVNEESVIYAKKLEGHFDSNSEIIILELTEEEQQMKTFEIIALKCPSFSYFLETFMVKEMVEDLLLINSSLDEIVSTVIHYAEYDA